LKLTQWNFSDQTLNAEGTGGAVLSPFMVRGRYREKGWKKK